MNTPDSILMNLYIGSNYKFDELRGDVLACFRNIKLCVLANINIVISNDHIWNCCNFNGNSSKLPVRCFIQIF